MSDETSKRLSQTDVLRLLDDPSGETRAETAAKIASDFGSGDLSDDERRIAEDIFGVMVRDAEIRVRQALSANLKDCPYLSSDVAMTLAKDVESVSLPIIQFSTVLTDENLVEIVNTQGVAKQKAVAQRVTVSPVVADALVETENEDVVTTLVKNEGASISEPSFKKVLDNFGHVEEISASIAVRKTLPVAVAERLVTLVSDRIREHILSHHDLPAEQVSDLIMESREKATLGLLTPDTSSNDVRELIVQLYQNGRLTPTIILRAVCMGDLPFFEAAVAVLARIPLTNARALIHDKGPLGLDAVLRKAGLPQNLFPAFEAAISVSHENDYDGGEHDRERFRKRMIERVLTRFGDPVKTLGEEDTEYLLAKLSRIDQELSPTIH
jgi:uncharacterized protein (DUF2336 family)